MKLKTLFILHSIVALVNGGGCILAPEGYPGLFGISVTSPDARLMTQLFGAGLLTYCCVAWLARDSDDSAARRAIVLGFFITLTIGFILSLVGKLSGVGGALAWLVVGLYLVFALGYGYFRFVKP